MNQKEYLKKLFLQALERCSPANAVAEVISRNDDHCRIKDHSFSISEKKIYVLSVGKASVDMFNSACEILGEGITDSLVITPDQKQAKSCKGNKVIISSHPVPDEQSLKAGQAAVSFLEEIPENALLLFLISGGASSLLCLPAPDISISDLQRTFDLLNNSGAAIHEMNTVRKHCSQVKGGQLLNYLNPHVTLIDLVVSDIPDNNLSMIGSGPTAEDVTTFSDSCNVLLKYDLWEKIPASVQNHIGKGIAGEVDETLKQGEDPVSEHHSYIISSAKKFANELAELAIKDGFRALIADEAYNAEVEKVASVISDTVLGGEVNESEGKESRSKLFIFYGESMVKVSGKGKGGRNQELALQGALNIEGHKKLTWLSAGTDGIDGPTDAAGAIVDGQTIKKARQKGLNVEEFLSQNNSYHFHDKMNTLLKTGYTGNNLMDVTLVIKN